MLSFTRSHLIQACTKAALSLSSSWFVFLLLLGVTFFGCGQGTTSTEKSPTEKTVDAGSGETAAPKETGPQCKGNNDGIIESKEVTYAVGVTVNIRRNKPGTIVSVNQVGNVNDKGIRVWDFREAQATTHDTIKTVSPTGKWFVSKFPQANLLVPVPFKGINNQVFQILRYTNDQLFLEGIASDKEKPEQDKVFLPYNTPIPLLKFPLRDGDEWVVSAKTQGNVGTLPVASTDTYQIRVAGRGTVKLPDIQFNNTLRIVIKVRQRFLGGQTRQRYQVLYFHECFGEIARAESKDNETKETFNRATLLRFLSF